MSIAVANTSANLTGKTVMAAENAETVTGLKTFNRGAAVPFAVDAASLKVTNLDADKLDGVDGSGYATYAQGSWTPTIVSSGGGVPTYGAPTAGYYVKKGKDVSVQGIITLSALGTLAAGGLSIGGLPFAAGSGAGEYASGSIGYWQALATAMVQMGMLLAPSGSTITITSLAAAGVGTGQLQVANISGTFQVAFGLQYRTT